MNNQELNNVQLLIKWAKEFSLDIHTRRVIMFALVLVIAVIGGIGTIFGFDRAHYQAFYVEATNKYVDVMAIYRVCAPSGCDETALAMVFTGAARSTEETDLAYWNTASLNMLNSLNKISTDRDALIVLVALPPDSVYVSLELSCPNRHYDSIEAFNMACDVYPGIGVPIGHRITWAGRFR